MANAVEKVNTIEIGDIEKVNTITDDNLEDLNTLEFAGVTDAHTLIATATSDGSDATLGFTSGIDSTSLHPQTDNVNFVFSTNMSGDAGGDFDVNVMNSTFYQSYHKEDGSDSNLAYSSGNDVSNEDGIVFVPLLAGLQNDADSSASGVFTWYGPIGINAVVGTYGRYYGFQKQWISRFNFQNSDPHYTTDSNTAGQMGNYNTDHSWQGHTEIRFKMSSGNIDAGEVKMYGLAIA